MREYHSTRDRTTTMYGHAVIAQIRKNSGGLRVTLAEPVMSIVG
jgi:hypothetical protein